VIELLQFPPAFGLMNASPFCMKVEVFLRLAGLEYRCVDQALPLKMPKGKLPVLRDGAELVPDSQTIVEHLQRRWASQLSPALRGPEPAADLPLRRMVEEHSYFALLWLRWIDDDGWALTRAAFFGKLPPVVSAIVPPLVRRKIGRDLAGQGMGRHDKAEICRRAGEDLGALAAALGARPFFGGAEPSALDASIYAYLANLLWVPLDSPLKRATLAAAPLVGYAQRMRERVGSAPRPAG
jgi:glutathione S-transferase